MSGWPRWAGKVAPGALPQYVHRGAVGPLLPRDLAKQLPGPSDEPAMHRAQQVYEVLAQCGIRYVHEPTSSEAGRQTIRPLDQVLTGPRQATCLDIAVTFSGACLDAGLHPVVVTLDSARGGPGHALVLVWLDGSWVGAPERGYPWRDVVLDTAPAELVGQLRAALDQPGSFLAIDVTGATRPHGAEPTNWAEAITRGAEMVTSAITGNGAWRWDVGVDIGLGWHADDVHPLSRWPRLDPLVEPYLPPIPDGGPLMQLRARRSVVPFYTRDELDVLTDWCQTPETEQGTRLAVVHGVGGSGKTHLAAELADRLVDDNWYAGFLTRHASPDDLAWLAGVVSPLLVVVDYPEDVRADTVFSLLQALRDREEPACVVLTARTLGTWWTKDILGALQREGIPHAELLVELPPRHPRTTGVFQRALRAFGELPGMASADVDTPPPDRRWTTLDLIMLAWLAAHGATALPTSPEQLYDQILDREFDYWRRVCLRRGMAEPHDELLPTVGACVTLLAPTPTRVEPILRAVAALTRADQWRHQIAAIVQILLPPDSETGTVTLRPDPVGERLVLQILGSDRVFLSRCLDVANNDEQLNACVTITRAAERDQQGAAVLATAVLTARPGLWQPALAVVAAQGGPFQTPLQILADRDDSPLPLAQLADTIPLGHVTLRDLALLATQRTRPPDPADPDDHEAHARLAGWWNNLSVRQAGTGDRAGALDSITEAVAIRRQLTQASPAAYLPDLAGSLNNLAIRYVDTGDLRRALDAFATAWADLSPGPRAELAVARAHWRASRDDLAGAKQDLGEAAKWAQQETDPHWAGQSRRTVRDAVTALLTTGGSAPAPQPDLPEWAWRPLPDDLIEVLNHWLSAASWEDRESLLRTDPGLNSQDGRDTVRLACELYPEVQPLAQLAHILDNIAARGLDDILAEHRAAHQHADLLRQWLTTETWSASREFLQAHPGLLSDPRTLAALQAGADDPVFAQYLGVARLANRMPIPEVYDAITDRDMAVDAAMGCIEHGDAAKLHALFLAAPHLGQLPFVTPFLVAVHAVLTNAGEPGGDTPTAADLMRSAADDGSAIQRGAGAARLRRLARRLPAHAEALHNLADILTAPSSSDQECPA